MQKFNPVYQSVFLLLSLFLVISCKRDSNNANPSVVKTTEVTSLLPHMVETGGSIVSNSSGTIKMRGVCWGTMPKPDTSQHKKALISKTEDFIVILSKLTPATRYYYRAFIVNENGLIYGDEKEFVTLENGPNVTDIDGNEYQTVKIGTQTWMKENLKVSRYNNGDSIPTGLDNRQWQTTQAGAFAIFNNQKENNDIFGKIYNWYVVQDERNVCPIGWHVPSQEEWTSLENFLGGEEIAGSKMKAVSNLWRGSSKNITNEGGFSGLPAGSRFASGGYGSMFQVGCWAMDDNRNLGSGFFVVIVDWGDFSGKGSEMINRGFSVRCIKD